MGGGSALGRGSVVEFVGFELIGGEAAAAPQDDDKGRQATEQ
jgi:hypothetical protein